MLKRLRYFLWREPGTLAAVVHIDLDAAIPDCNFAFRVPDEQLNGTEDLGAAVHQHGFGAPQRKTGDQR